MRTLREKTRLFLNDQALIDKRDMWFERLLNLFEGRPDAYNEKYVFSVHGFVPRPADESMPYTDPENWVIECLEMLSDLPEMQRNRFMPLCVEYPIYGVHFIDKMFGADVFFKDGQWNARYLKTPIGKLEMPDLEKDETWMLARRAAKAFLDADVKLPLFGLPTLSSALNIMVNLYGGDALIAMIEDEENALNDLTVINNLIRALHKWYLDTIPHKQLQPVISWERTQPPGFGQLCGCTTQLLSGKMYERLIAPLDDQLLSDYPNGGMIHLCGAHSQHIETFRNMKNLRALQLNDRASHDLKLYLDGLREDQIIYLAPCEGMSIEKALEISKGKRIVLPAPINAPEKPL